MELPEINKNALKRSVGRRARLTLAALALPVLAACSDGNDTIPAAPEAAGPFDELIAQGIARYLGLYTPMLSETAGAVVNHTFGAGDGPLCGDGSEYSMSTRDQGSSDLMIFIEGGGACWSDYCIYVDSIGEKGIPENGILDPELANNPVKDFNHVYLPYCDGSLSAGDVDIDTDDDGENDRFQRGLHNLSAALDVAASTFPSPSRIVLAGQSGGGYSTIFALPLVRELYPDVPIDVINDSGVGIARPNDPAFLEQLIDEWDISAFIPESCADCLPDDGHMTNYLIWQTEQDPNVRRSYLSYSGDTIVGTNFLRIGGASYEQALIAEMAKQEAAHPDRVRSWIAPGLLHTFIVASPQAELEGVVLMDWLDAMLSGSADWVSLME